MHFIEKFLYFCRKIIVKKCTMCTFEELESIVMLYKLTNERL